MSHHHSGEGEGLLEVEEALILVGLGCLQDLLEEGVLIVASCYDCLVLQGRSPAGRRSPWPLRPPS
jgi:hypothetical protein